MNTEALSPTLTAIRDRATLSVPEAGALLNLGRAASYAAAQRGDLPTVRIGRRVVVPAPMLLRMLGVEQ